MILSNLIYVTLVRQTEYFVWGYKTMFGYVVSYQINLASEEGWNEKIQRHCGIQNTFIETHTVHPLAIEVS